MTTPMLVHVAHSVGFAIGFLAAAISLLSALVVAMRYLQETDHDIRSGWLRMCVILTFLGLAATGAAAAADAASDACSVEQQEVQRRLGRTGVPEVRR